MMALTDQMVALARHTLEDPRAGVRALLALGVPLPARTVGLLLVSVLSALLVHLGFLILPATDDPIAQFMSQSPFRSAVIQWVILAATVLAIYRIGRAFGGRGTLSDSLLVVVWLQVIMLGVQVIQLLVLILFAPLAGLVNLAGLVLFFWLFTSFIAEIHGFASRWAVLVGVIGAGFAVAFVLVVVLSMLFGPEVFQGV
jgi:Yip1 domain